jgi:hypothetical protein
MLKKRSVNFEKKDFKKELINQLQTKEEMKHIKDSLFEGIRSKIFMLEKASNRIKMQKYGFIKPEHITWLDY